MAAYNIEIIETIDAPRDKVFALFADHQRFGQLLGAPIKRIKDSDQADPNGIGSVRKIGFGPVGFEETVLNFEPDSLIEYSITTLSPIKNHVGRICFADTPEGQTRINYTISFEDVVPFTGKMVSSALEQAIRRGIKKAPSLA
ncbi:SRPBCC family protein [Marinobacter sp. chi1]|uniref:SRPBCC family protein n=1 Tax=Marinobacter suaedae TaxID=3057675 RepID=A0ABT8W3M3_9GAMM|nr:SRPBCC family protein [Marinobacter sp. chi1]MDO3722849.1 SRPBCC family protein [Marinobacter sp. chi1]